MGQGIVKRYGVHKKLPPIDTSFANCTWEEISNIVDAKKVNDYINWSLGNTKDNYILLNKTNDSLTIIKHHYDNSEITSQENAKNIASSLKNSFNATYNANAKESRLLYGSEVGIGFFATANNRIYYNYNGRDNSGYFTMEDRYIVNTRGEYVRTISGATLPPRPILIF